MSNLSVAIALAAQKFQNHNDKGGTPYILHCLHVMRTIQSRDESVKIAAILHDVVEDNKVTGMTMEDVAAYGFSNKAMMLLKMLTHDKKTVDYNEYIHHIALNKDAADIKIADLKHNSDLTRLKGTSEKDFHRAQKYQESYTYLISIYPELKG